MDISIKRITHAAFADESRHVGSRYHGLSLVTLQLDNFNKLKSEIQKILTESGVETEFKWGKVRNAKYRFAGEKLIDFSIKKILSEMIRIDVLTWDIKDSRHKNVQNRDDTENLIRMYHHLFKNVLDKRWPDGCVWVLAPDERSDIDWNKVKTCLISVSTKIKRPKNLFAYSELGDSLKSFSVYDIKPQISTNNCLVQLADLFVGLGVFSRGSFDVYQKWMEKNSKQMNLFSQSIPNVGQSDEAKCSVLNKLLSHCKNSNLKISFNSSNGLKTFKPNGLLNFWWYTPQHMADKAPSKNYFKY